MRLLLCVAMVAVLLVASQCTATAIDNPDVVQREDDRGDAVVAATTTTAAQTNSDVQPKQEGTGRQAKVEGEVQDNSPTGIIHTNNPGAQSPSGVVQNKDIGAEKQDEGGPNAGHDNNAKEERTVREGEEMQRKNTVNGLEERVVPPPKPSVTTTTTTVNDKPAQLPDGSQKEITQNTRGENNLKESGASPPEPELGNSLTTEVKTTTTTAAVQTISGSQEEKVQEQSTLPKDGDAIDVKVHDAEADAATTTTHAPTNTLPKESKIQQPVNNKDRCSSTSLLLAFAMLATLAVIDIAQVS